MHPIRPGVRAWSFRLGLAVAGLGASVALHCGSSGESLFAECEPLYGERCGRACSSDVECGAGLHCSNGRCNAFCGPGRSCDRGLSCTPEGRCLAGGPFEDGGSDPNACADLALTLTKKIPTVLVLVDRSGSMDSTFGTAPATRWTTLKSVLLDKGIIENLQSEVRFGMTTYANTDGPGCPTLESVPFALDNYTAIDQVLRPAATQPHTPTGESIYAVAGVTDAGVVTGGLAALDSQGGEKIILLVTDGDPDYCGNPLANDAPIDPVEQAKAKTIAVDSVKQAFLAGIKTYVLAIGDEVSAPHQQEMANAGLGLPANAPDAAPFYRPNDEAELIDQINTIIYGTRPCTFTLNGAVQAGSEAKGVVELNGTPLSYGDANGWRLTSPTELEIVGEACATAKNSPSASITARFPCGAVIIVK